MDELIKKLKECISVIENNTVRVNHNDGCDYDYGYQNGIDHMIDVIEDVLADYENEISSLHNK